MLAFSSESDVHNAWRTKYKAVEMGSKTRGEKQKNIGSLSYLSHLLASHAHAMCFTLHVARTHHLRFFGVVVGTFRPRTHYRLYCLLLFKVCAVVCTFSFCFHCVVSLTLGCDVGTRRISALSRARNSTKTSRWMPMTIAKTRALPK